MGDIYIVDMKGGRSLVGNLWWFFFAISRLGASKKAPWEPPINPIPPEIVLGEDQ